jgi:deoxyribonuclease-4
MGADRIVVHPGSLMKMTRERAVENIKQLLLKVFKEVGEKGLNNIHICPETMGKINQIGTIDEIIEICQINETLIPTIDFGHIHARGLGCLNNEDDFLSILNLLENGLGYERIKNFHCHFSRIEFTAGGEKRHRTISETEYGPEFTFLAKVLLKKKLEPIIICESRGTMAEDALKLQSIYEGLKENK